MRTTYDAIQPYVTKDGSQIRELMHPAVHGNRNQSFAEATVAPGARTALHRHTRTEEIYHITHGEGVEGVIRLAAMRHVQRCRKSAMTCGRIEPARAWARRRKRLRRALAVSHSLPHTSLRSFGM